MLQTKVIEIGAVHQVRGALRSAERFGFPVLVVGNPGMGKTTALRRVAEECLYRLDSNHFNTSSLFVDEYQTFEPRVLRELLHIHERCGFALVLSGNRERLAKSARDAGALDQIESRIGMRFRMERPSPNDCASIGIEFNVEGRESAHEAP